MTLVDYLSGAAIGLSIWLGLRWPGRAVRLAAALLAIVVAVSLGVIADLTGGVVLALHNRDTLSGAVMPGLLSFLLALAFGRVLRRKSGGSTE